MSELLGELADVYERLGRTDDALEAMRAALAAGWSGAPDGRCRLAEILLRAGRAGEAHLTALAPTLGGASIAPIHLEPSGSGARTGDDPATGAARSGYAELPRTPPQT